MYIPRKCRIAERVALREGVASRLPSLEGLGGGFTYMIRVIQGSSHAHNAFSLRKHSFKTISITKTFQCGDPCITCLMEVNPPPNPSKEGSRDATPSRDATLPAMRHFYASWAVRNPSVSQSLTFPIPTPENQNTPPPLRAGCGPALRSGGQREPVCPGRCGCPACRF